MYDSSPFYIPMDWMDGLDCFNFLMSFRHQSQILGGIYTFWSQITKMGQRYNQMLQRYHLTHRIHAPYPRNPISYVLNMINRLRRDTENNFCMVTAIVCCTHSLPSPCNLGKWHPGPLNINLLEWIIPCSVHVVSCCLHVRPWKALYHQVVLCHILWSFSYQMGEQHFDWGNWDSVCWILSKWVVTDVMGTLCEKHVLCIDPLLCQDKLLYSKLSLYNHFASTLEITYFAEVFSVISVKYVIFCSRTLHDAKRSGIVEFVVCS